MGDPATEAEAKLALAIKKSTATGGLFSFLQARRRR